MIFLDNKYHRWYDLLVKVAKNRAHSSNMERHHIVPKSLGGSNDRTNIVSLTYREHFLAHWLLTKFTTESGLTKMKRALWAMSWKSSTHERIVSGWQYAMARGVLSHIGRELGLSGKGKKKSEEHCRKISEALTGKPKSDSHRNNLSKHSPSLEHRKKISEKLTGRTYSDETLARMREVPGRPHTEETKAKLMSINSGIKFSDERCANISAALKGKRIGIPHSPEHKAKIAEAARKRERDRNGCWITK